VLTLSDLSEIVLSGECVFQIEEKISRFINFKQAQNDSSNIREFCGAMNRSWRETAEGTTAVKFAVTFLTLT